MTVIGLQPLTAGIHIRAGESLLISLQLYQIDQFTPVSLSASFSSYTPFSPSFCLIFHFFLASIPFHLMRDQSRGYYWVSNTLPLQQALSLNDWQAGRFRRANVGQAEA